MNGAAEDLFLYVGAVEEAEVVLPGVTVGSLWPMIVAVSTRERPRAA
jgi:hypothetical protein